MARSNQSRLIWVDTLRGFGIILVVLGHAVRGLHSAGLMREPLFEAIDNRIYAFHMPLFFLIAGLFLLRGIEQRPPTQVLSRQVQTLLYPMVIWTYLFLGAKYLAGGASNAPITASELLVSPFPGKLHFWFLWALFLIQLLLLALVQSVGPLSQGLRLHILLAVSSLIALFCLGAVPQSASNWIRPALTHLPFVVAGLLLGQRLDRFDVSQAQTLLASLAFLVFLAVLPALPDYPGDEFIRAALICPTVVIAARGLSSHPTLSWMAVFGPATMAIFLMHTIFSAGIRAYLVSIGVTDLLLHLILGTLIGLVVPYWFYALSRGKKWTPWLGWR